MASIVERPKRDGTSTFQVRWRDGGGRVGKVETENFDSEDAAEQFKDLVNAHRQHWPPGWVRGVGFVEEKPIPGDRPLTDYADQYVRRLTGTDRRTREDYARDIRLHLSRIVHTTPSGLVVPATVGNVVSGDIQDWVALQQDGVRDPERPEEWVYRKADPKSIRNRHGLAFCVFQAAMEAEPPLRSRNPCKGTSLPRVDDHVDEEMCFLEPVEYDRVRAEITDPDAADLADWLVGTGTRWGEATALKVCDLQLAGSKPSASIVRAWKKAPKGSDSAFYLGPPKTKKARRVLRLSSSQVEMLRRRTAGLPESAFVFRTSLGNHWRHANFYNRKWMPAVREAMAKGLPKKPRIHDLRHTHVAWLIARHIALPKIQARLGHESISTTVDRYGHLLEVLDDELSEVIEDMMAPPAQRGLCLVQGA
ncbi:site-specific integrase [Streptomyces sp. AV19]|uniref:tyrosine-type recombinase/integrase n=1 Tax=Streptomyces sp. AV19 TaxID=2793068 RepID=UPI0018FEBA22|nr:site-specific integrase [Streptomyces sp. AV19]MBH1932926.1 site-specific integrase [Streptomyces sp. AV19]MDG4531676.1 site-specific integrase [Streptomyces sp. AV19]